MKHHQTGLTLLAGLALLACAPLAGPAKPKDPLAAVDVRTVSSSRVPLMANPQRVKEGALTVASSGPGVASGPPGVSGPQLVAVSPNVYELRDGVRALPVARPAIASADALQGLRIEVSNGVGIRSLARRTADRLASYGVVTARLSNEASYRQAKTEIQYAVGQEQAAQGLSSLLPLAVTTVSTGGLTKNFQMRLVLGHDQAGKAVAAWVVPDTGMPPPQVTAAQGQPVDWLRYRSYRSPAASPLVTRAGVLPG
jgi:hypothetical protein